MQISLDNTMHNIDDFNRGCALILNALYQRFPVTIDLTINGLDDYNDLPSANHERIEVRLEVYSSTVQFLADEGLLRYKHKDIRGLLFTETVLTSKGLAALQKTPDAIAAPRKTLADRLQAGLGSVSKDVLREVIKALLSA